MNLTDRSQVLILAIAPRLLIFWKGATDTVELEVIMRNWTTGVVILALLATGAAMSFGVAAAIMLDGPGINAFSHPLVHS